MVDGTKMNQNDGSLKVVDKMTTLDGHRGQKLDSFTDYYNPRKDEEVKKVVNLEAKK